MSQWYRLCEKCDYDLWGLPLKHVCPECGTPYDWTTCEIPISDAPRLRRELWGTGFVGICVMAVIWYRHRDAWTAVLLFVGYTLYLIWRLRRDAAMNDRLVLNLETAAVVERGAAQIMPLADLQEVRFNDSWGYLQLVDHAGRVRLRVPVKRLEAAGGPQIVAEEVNAWLAAVKARGVGTR
jgi:hypothetical protein